MIAAINLGADANSLSAIGALLACVIALIAFWAQRTHNKLSVRPLPQITLEDRAGELCVKLVNNGTGPLIIECLRVIKGNRELSASLIDVMPKQVHMWDWFVPAIDGRSIPVGGTIVLIRYKLSAMGVAEFKMVRNALAELEIRMLYRDVYNGQHPAYCRSLDWFARWG